ncbi:MAG: (d)CMP kinase [Halobacteriota archaeon]
MIVTVSGLPGSGTTTLAKRLSDAYDLEYVSGGDVFREEAERRGVSVGEFNLMVEEEPEIDRELDERQTEIARERDDVLLESRLAGHMAGEHADLRVWLKASEDVRAERVAERESVSVEDALLKSREREASEAKRYMELYDIDVSDLGVYDLVVDTERWDADGVEVVVSAALEGLP